MNSSHPSEKHLLIPGPTGQLEAITNSSLSDVVRQATVIICHPHPLHGGTMNNKVVTTLEKTFRELDLATVRFNFRGVGKSEGVFGEGIGEVDDLLAVMDWVKKEKPQDDIWLAGFSFGAFIAATVATRVTVSQLVTVAPQVSRFIEAKTPAIVVPWILVEATRDEIIPPDETEAWYQTLDPKPVFIQIEASHFFHGKLVELRERLKIALNLQV